VLNSDECASHPVVWLRKGDLFRFEWFNGSWTKTEICCCAAVDYYSEMGNEYVRTGEMPCDLWEITALTTVGIARFGFNHDPECREMECIQHPWLRFER